MARQTLGNRITVESSAALVVGMVVRAETSGLWAASAADTAVDGVVVAIGGETAAPYTATVQLDGIAQVLSDGSGAIDEQDALCAGATAGYVKTRATTDGTTIRHFAGKALSPAAATVGLLVDMIIRPFHRGGA